MPEDAIEHYTGTVQNHISFYWVPLNFGHKPRQKKLRTVELIDSISSLVSY